MADPIHRWLNLLKYCIKLLKQFPFYLGRYCVPESPRWLLAKGRLEDLYQIVERAARMNGIKLPANYKKSLEAVVPRQNTLATVEDDKIVKSDVNTITTTTITATTTTTSEVISSDASPLVVVFSKAYWRTTCLTLIVWLTLIIIYFGLTLHLSNLGGNIYVNTVS